MSHNDSVKNRRLAKVNPYGLTKDYNRQFSPNEIWRGNMTVSPSFRLNLESRGNSNIISKIYIL